MVADKQVTGSGDDSHPITDDAGGLTELPGRAVGVMTDHDRAAAALDNVALPAVSMGGQRRSALLVCGFDTEYVPAVRVERVVARHPGRRS